MRGRVSEVLRCAIRNTTKASTIFCGHDLTCLQRTSGTRVIQHAYVCANAHHGIPLHSHPVTADSLIVVLTHGIQNLQQRLQSTYYKHMNITAFVRSVHTSSSYDNKSPSDLPGVLFPEPPAKIASLKSLPSPFHRPIPTEHHPYWAKQITQQTTEIDMSLRTVHQK